MDLACQINQAICLEGQLLVIALGLFSFGVCSSKVQFDDQYCVQLKYSSMCKSHLLTNLQVGIRIPVSRQRVFTRHVGPGTYSGTSHLSCWIFLLDVIISVVLGLPCGLVPFNLYFTSS